MDQMWYISFAEIKKGIAVTTQKCNSREVFNLEIDINQCPHRYDPADSREEM